MNDNDDPLGLQAAMRRHPSARRKEIHTVSESGTYRPEAHILDFRQDGEQVYMTIKVGGKLHQVSLTTDDATAQLMTTVRIGN